MGLLVTMAGMVAVEHACDCVERVFVLGWCPSGAGMVALFAGRVAIFAGTVTIFAVDNVLTCNDAVRHCHHTAGDQRL